MLSRLVEENTLLKKKIAELEQKINVLTKMLRQSVAHQETLMESTQETLAESMQETLVEWKQRLLFF